MIEKLGKYDIVSEIGKGAMGVVYKAHDPMIDRPVALKTIHSNLLEGKEGKRALLRFKREAQAAGRLSHPNIVGVYEYGEENDVAFIAMEFVQGQEVKDIFERDERFPLDRSIDIMEQLLSALSYAHNQGVVHRDIKPANVMLLEDGTVKVTDFGVARIESSTMTQAGAILGTPSYMSPEQFMGQTVDNRSDLFSAGALFYQLLTGEKPFSGSLTTIMHRILNVEPDPPSALNKTLSPAFDKLLAQALAKKPDDRFQSADDFKEAILKLKDATATDAIDPDATLEATLPDIDPDATLELTVDTDATLEATLSEIDPDATLEATVDTDSTLASPPPQTPAAAPKAPPIKPVLFILAAIIFAGTAYIAFPMKKNASSVSNVTGDITQDKASSDSLGKKPGILSVSTTPTGAVITLADGTFLGMTPKDVSLVPGDYIVQFKKKGFKTEELSVEIEESVRIPFSLTMMPQQ